VAVDRLLFLLFLLYSFLSTLYGFPGFNKKSAPIG